MSYSWLIVDVLITIAPRCLERAGRDCDMPAVVAPGIDGNIIFPLP